MEKYAALHFNRKLLCSVFNAQEAREAVLGGARIIDSEDPKSALGNIKPRKIMDVSNAVLDFHRDFEVQLSTNIGEDQLLFWRSDTGQAIEKSSYEISGKAAQASIGVACAMGTRVHPCNLVKVGVDGMYVGQVKEVLTEVVNTLRSTEAYSHSQVMSVLFAQNISLWRQRQTNNVVRNVLVGLRQFYSSDPADPLSFDLTQYAVGTLRDTNGAVLFSDSNQVSLGSLIKASVLPKGSNTPNVRVNELFAHSDYFPGLGRGDVTNRAVIKAMVDVTAAAGANAIMLDTSILSKVSNICLVDTSGSDEMVDLNRFCGQDGMVQSGILKLEDLRFFVDYCHYQGVEANLAGSIESYQAQQLWVLIPELDQISSRGSSSAVSVNPSNPSDIGANTRQYRVIDRNLVQGLVAPEHGGVLNLPEKLRDLPEARNDIQRLRDSIAKGRAQLGLPALQTNFVDAQGHIVATLNP
jgi:uncharacterized protein (UPF0264 family)